MNRAIPAAVITAIGLGALASFKSTTGLPAKSSTAIVVPHTTAPASGAPPSNPPTTGSPPTSNFSPQTTPKTTTPKTTPPTAAAGQTRTITGDAVDSQYGIVQIQVTLKGNQIADIVALQMPNSHRRSVEISQQAEPILRQEVLQAQSAQINIVSGATFTSESYAQSLQGALDRSHG
jgi:uncharacterized protein with FMN-binding domain